jgi:hypothetical protein
VNINRDVKGAALPLSSKPPQLQTATSSKGLLLLLLLVQVFAESVKLNHLPELDTGSRRGQEVLFDSVARVRCITSREGGVSRMLALHFSTAASCTCSTIFQAFVVLTLAFVVQAA